ncbi:hypothetical protein [Pseudovibrio sp. Tun.PSC04-5.I4]|uniref:hypothetical protein n=1 Tax=Pseudovibrio sp. Tun.PSC04-5.I4 TaxID=1798213 RepID=UPI0008849920|nr:hypothetical protein [Pseudovibrio sp. Tun.PSC04-5.I4]SDR36417.1 hypothetical protein SAMN04515695_4976 [Pseudovibrio sp. Tun.PSC04-5.I4]
MSKCIFDEIDQFASPAEYERFPSWALHQENAGHIEELLSDEAQGGFAGTKRYKCVATEEIWALHAPDPGYFPGALKRENES